MQSLTEQHGNKGKEGYWNDRSFHRRSIEDLEVRSFCGMQIFYDMIEAAENKDRYSPYEYPYCSERDKALLSCLFETGGRELEVAMLRKEMFDVDEEFVIVRDMPLVKRYKRTKLTDKATGEVIVVTKSIKDFRTLTFKRDEPLAEFVVQWIDQVEDYLFPSRRNGKFPHLHPTRIYQIIDDLSLVAGHNQQIIDREGNLIMRNGEPVTRGAMWPHRIRSERASYLGSVLKWNLEKIMRFFGWKTTEIAMRYAHKSVEDMKTWF